MMKNLLKTIAIIIVLLAIGILLLKTKADGSIKVGYQSVIQAVMGQKAGLQQTGTLVDLFQK